MEKAETKGGRLTHYKVKKPAMHNVVMHNDDVTTMDFVVMVLQRVFHKSAEEAEVLMMKVHNEGAAIVGTYYRDIAESKANYAMMLAGMSGYPLKVTTEEA